MIRSMKKKNRLFGMDHFKIQKTLNLVKGFFYCTIKRKQKRIMNNQQLIADLRNQSFHCMEFPGYHHVLTYFDAWKAFRELPLDVKQKIEYLTDYGRGYEYKDEHTPVPSGHKPLDRKDNYHYLPIDHERVLGIAKKMDKEYRNIVEDFLNACSEYSIACTSFIESITPELQSLVHDQNVDLTKYIQKSKQYWISRALYYHPNQSPRAEIAADHCDKAMITLNFEASAPGLHCTDVNTLEQHGVVIKKGEVMIQLGLQGDYLMNLKALPHGVGSSEKTTRDGRYTGVFFAIMHGIPVYNKAEYGPTKNIDIHEYLRDWTHDDLKKRFMLPKTQPMLN